jgi:hypothetical protein
MTHDAGDAVALARKIGRQPGETAGLGCAKGHFKIPALKNIFCAKKAALTFLDYQESGVFRSADLLFTLRGMKLPKAGKIMVRKELSLN